MSDNTIIILLAIAAWMFFAELTIRVDRYTRTDWSPFDYTYGLSTWLLARWWGRPIIYLIWVFYWPWVTIGHIGHDR